MTMNMDQYYVSSGQWKESCSLSLAACQKNFFHVKMVINSNKRIVRGSVIRFGEGLVRRRQAC